MDEKDEVLEEVPEQPLEVTIKKEKATEAPNFDYDDYTPSDNEILEIEKEITDKIKKDTKNG